MRPEKQRFRNWEIFFCIVGFFLALAAYYPGFLSPDPLLQYEQAITGKYDDWHPPIMAGLWKILNYISNGPQSMLVFQLLCLYISLYILLKTFQNKSWKFLLVLFSFAPFIQNFAGYIVKDSQMALTWMLAFSLLLFYDVKNKKIPAVIAFIILLLIVYGSWVRTNAFPGAVPLCIWWGWLVCKKYSVSYKISGAILLMAFALSGHWMQERIFKSEKAYPEYKFYLQDITGIYLKTGEFPATLLYKNRYDTAFLHKNYQPSSIDYMLDNDSLHVIPEGDEVTTLLLSKAWRMEILKHPFVYLETKLEGFIYYLRLKDSGHELTVYYPQIDENKFGFSYSENFISGFFLRPIEWQTPLPYMKPWFWFFLNILLFFLIPFLRMPAIKRAFNVLIFSGLFYQGLMVILFPIDTDFRYFYWNCIACSVALCLLVVDRLRREQ